MSFHCNPHKFLRVGPGGYNCSCCFPRPGSGARKAEFRKAKRKFEQLVRREVQEQITDEEAWVLEQQAFLSSAV